MESIKFNHNYNNKLMCISFTTIRLRDDQKYKVGEFYELFYKWQDPDNGFAEISNHLGQARLLDIKHFMLRELTIFMSHIDMNLHSIEGKKELMRIYKDKDIDWSTQQLSYLLLEQDDTQMRYIMPDRIKKINRTADLFSGIPAGYEIVTNI